MPLARYLAILAGVLALAAATVLVASLIAPDLPAALPRWSAAALLAATGAAFLLTRRSR